MTQAAVRRFGNVDRTQHRSRDYGRGFAIDGQKLQCFAFVLQNNAGTIRHVFLNDISVVPNKGAYFDRIIGARPDSNYVNTPTVSASVDFVGGGGIVSGALDHFYFNTEEQNHASMIEMSMLEFYSGNVVRPRPMLSFVSRNVNGITRRRLDIQFMNDLSGAAWNINTTNLPSGQVLSVRVIVALQ